MSTAAPSKMTQDTAAFRVGFSADFCREDGKLAFPDIGLSLLDKVPGVHYEFLSTISG